MTARAISKTRAPRYGFRTSLPTVTSTEDTFTKSSLMEDYDPTVRRPAWVLSLTLVKGCKVESPPGNPPPLEIPSTPLTSPHSLRANTPAFQGNQHWI